jgi:CRISPR-associated protein Cas2
MLVLVSYDARTDTPAGRRRLRRIARACLDWGQRVQYSVFACELDPAQWASLKARLAGLIDPGAGSLRFYYLGANRKRRVEHLGGKPSLALDGPLVF